MDMLLGLDMLKRHQVGTDILNVLLHGALMLKIKSGYVTGYDVNRAAL